MLARPHHRDETSATTWALGPNTSAHHPMFWGDGPHMAASPAQCDHETGDAMPVRWKRRGGPSSHAPIRAERPTPDSHALPPSRDETVRPRDRAGRRPLQQRPLNRETLNDRLAPPTIPPPTTHHPEHPIERGNHDSQTHPEANNARINDAFHREAYRATAGTTTTRKPPFGAHATRVVERAGKRNAVTETHFRSDLSR